MKNQLAVLLDVRGNCWALGCTVGLLEQDMGMTATRAQPEWQAHTESLRSTALRTFSIAFVMGSIIAWSSHGRVTWPVAVVVSLWPSLGGHFVELCFLNWLRPRLPASRSAQAAARLALWLVAGALFALLIRGTSQLLMPQSRIHLPVLVGAGGFVVIELVAHLGLQLRGRPSFYNAHG